MPRVRVAFKGPLLRERISIFHKGRRSKLSTPEIKEELDASLRWYLENMDIKYIMRGFPRNREKYRAEWQKYLRKVAKLKAKLPLKDPKRAYETAKRKIEKIKKMEKETLRFLKAKYEIRIRAITGEQIELYIEIPETITLPELASALTAVNKALEKQTRLSAEVNNRLLELGLSIDISRSKEYRQRVAEYLDELDRKVRDLGYNPLGYLAPVLEKYLEKGRLQSRRINKN